MIIEKVDPLRECFSDYSIDGNTLTIGDITLDLAAEEGEQQVIIPIGSCFGKVHRDLMPSCVYVSEVIIPPRKYETIIEKDNRSGTGTEDEDQETTKSIPIPLDTETVVLRLWPAVGNAETESNPMMEDTDAE